ncbi:MAG: TVP38/TMEM64 family protein [Minwuia sp.]|uniref:TVP38/TMEM64 family protein n=1 Tax=Minwuia sp. TaxID=2493630 RepID=UPI003A8A0FA7
MGAMAEGAGNGERSGMPAWAKALLAAVLVGGLIAAYAVLPLSDWIEGFRTWIEGLGPIGWVVFVFAYAFAVTALVPGGLVTLAAAVAFGLWAFPLVVIGATLGAGMSFLAGRYLARERVRRLIADRPKLRAVDQAIKEEGWKIVGLLRLSPVVPFSLQNWVLGATAAEFGPYMLATFFGIMPGTLLYVWIGSIGGAAAAGEEASTLQYVFFGIGILATLAVTVLVGRKASARLKQHGVEEPEQGDGTIA